jgi:hypothetical protein
VIEQQALDFEAMPKQLVELHVVLGGVGLEGSAKGCRDAEVEWHQLFAFRPFRGP